jgi:hypothetical protein
MPTLRIEHQVPSFEGWKKVFDSDPINRKQSGVKSYRIYRPTDDMNMAIVELDFGNMEELESALKALRDLWNKVQGTVIIGPQIRILDITESKDI